MDAFVVDPPRVVLAFDAFISYSSKDREVVEDIARQLEDVGGLSLWKDNWELTGGDDWIEALPSAIARSRALVAFVGPHGIGPWHREEMKIALRRAVERKDIRVIPVALPGAPADLDLPDFLRSRHVIDLRASREHGLYLIRRAILGARPGRDWPSSQDDSEEAGSSQRSSRLHIVEWGIACHRLRYEVTCRLANVQGKETIIVKTAMVRTHRTASHPVREALPAYLAPIGRTQVTSPISVPLTSEGIYQELASQRFLVPGEVEDLVIPISIQEGTRAVISFGVHWLIPDEPMYRLTETGYVAIGQRGTPGVPPEYRDDYHPGQHNLDKPAVLSTSDWPRGWPGEVSAEEWEYYGADERPG